MPEDRFGVSGRMTERRKRLASRLNRRNRRLHRGGPALDGDRGRGLADGHLTRHGQERGPAPACRRTLCTGWARCTRHGYPSYHYQTRGFRSYWRMSAGDQCTNYAAYVESTVYHVREPRFLLGNGGEWAATAAAHGVTVNHTPSVGAVAEWDGGAVGMGSAGHVAVVEAVGPHHSYIVISQQHIGGQRNDYDWTLIRAHRSSRLRGRRGRATSSTSGFRAGPTSATTTAGPARSASATRRPRARPTPGPGSAGA